MTFSRRPVQCLSSVTEWPRDGILRVEILADPPADYGLAQSYEKEKMLQRRSSMANGHDEFSLLFSTKGVMEDFFGQNEDDDLDAEHVESPLLLNDTSGLGNVTFKSDVAAIIKESEDDAYSEDYYDPTLVWSDEYIVEYSLGNDACSPFVSFFLMFLLISVEYGFLRLSPQTREKLNISVALVLVDPEKDACFGDTFSRFILKQFLGYDDVLMSSIKSLAESEDNKGYLRNVVSGAHYHFVSRWTSSTSYISAFFVMMIFVRNNNIKSMKSYSCLISDGFDFDVVALFAASNFRLHRRIAANVGIQHADLVSGRAFINRGLGSRGYVSVSLSKIFSLLRQSVCLFPRVIVSPLKILFSLSLAGMEAIMSEFFEDTTTAFYIILIVWIADQYDAIACHTGITKRYWLKFFYLYHFFFYAFNYRFSGQYSSLALLTMWLFTQHSMIYFFHHYELPVILQQAQIQEILMRNQPEGGPPPGAAAAIRVPHVTGANNNQNRLQLQQPQRMRGFNIGGIRIRFGFVFHNQQRRQQQRNGNGEQQQQGNETRETSENPESDNSSAPPVVDSASPSNEQLNASSQVQEEEEQQQGGEVEEVTNQEEIREDLSHRVEELREMQRDLGEISDTLRSIRENDTEPEPTG